MHLSPYNKQGNLSLKNCGITRVRRTQYETGFIPATSSTGYAQRWPGSAYPRGNTTDRLRAGNYSLRRPLAVYRDAAGLCSPDTAVCYPGEVRNAVPQRHLPQPRRPGAVEGLVHSRSAAEWEADGAAHHHHGAWQSHQPRRQGRGIAAIERGPCTTRLRCPGIRHARHRRIATSAPLSRIL